LGLPEASARRRSSLRSRPVHVLEAELGEVGGRIAVRVQVDEVQEGFVGGRQDSFLPSYEERPPEADEKIGLDVPEVVGAQRGGPSAWTAGGDARGHRDRLGIRAKCPSADWRLT
jgi:hypothetical protein